MKKSSPLTLSRLGLIGLLLAAFAFFAEDPSLAAPEDSLLALQKEVMAAKEKRAVFSNATPKKPGTEVSQGTAAPAPASAAPNLAASNLMNEIAGAGSVDAGSKDYKPVEIPVSGEAAKYQFGYPSPREFKPDPKLEPKTPWVFTTIPGFVDYGKNGPYHLSDAAAAYKVAISDGKITLKEAIQIAAANSIELQALAKKVEVAQAKVMEAKRGLFPTVQLQYDENGGHAPNGQRFYKGRAYKVNVTQPLYYGGELVLTVKQAEENLKSTQADLKKAAGDATKQVTEAYYGVVKAEYNAQYQVELVRDAQVIYDAVRKAHDQRLVPEVEYLNVVSQFQQISFSADSTHNDLLSAYLTLRQAMGLESSAEVPVDLKMEIRKLKPDFHQLLEFALRNNPNMTAKQLAYLSAKDGIKIYEAKKKPRFDLRGSYGELGESFLDSQELEADNANIDPEKEWYLGVHGSLPLGASTLEYDQIKHVYGPTVSAFQGSEDWRHTVKFNLLDKLADVTDSRGAEAALLQAEAEWQKARNELIFALKDELYNVHKAEIQMDSSVARMHYQERQNSILKYTVSMGEASAASYLEGLIEQSSNRFGFISSVADHNQALANLAIATGDPEYFENNEKR